MSNGATTAASNKHLNTGILFFVGAVCIFAVTDAIAKKLVTNDYSVIQIIWSRYFLHILPLIIASPLFGTKRLFVTDRIGLQLVRSFFMFSGMFLFMSSLRWIPLADAHAISYVSPLIATALAAWMLREHVSGRRWIAAIIGFVGVLIIIRPGGSSFHWALLLPLGMAATWAIFQIATRTLSGTDDKIATLFYTGCVGSILTTIMLPFVWITPTLADVFLFLLLGLFGLTSNALLIQAYTFAPASVLAPFTYFQLPWSVLLGFSIFGDLPAVHVLLGVILIFASNIYILRRGS